MKTLFTVILCLFCAFTPKQVFADPVLLESQVRELTKSVSELRSLVEIQQREIALLKASQLVPAQPVSGEVSASRSLTGRWNPDIGAVLDTVLKLDSPRVDEEGADRISVRELELVLGSAVDPYSRLDATIAFSDFEEASLEEAYYTHYGLPWGITARLGRFKPNLGKAIPMHRDSLDTVDEPLMIQRYFGLEGFNKSGADIKKTLDLPWESTHQVSFGVLEGGNGEDGTLFGETRRHPSIYAHLKNAWDLNDATNFELGVSHLSGSRDDDSTFEVNVIGLDGTLIYRYADQRHFKLQSEAFHVNRTESFLQAEGDAGEVILNDVDDNSGLWGTYALADWRFNPQWATGFRFDRVQLIDDPLDNPHSADVGFTGYLTFYQSEFARWRVQFTHLDLADGGEDDQVMIQGTFAIGEHKHKIQ